MANIKVITNVLKTKPKAEPVGGQVPGLTGQVDLIAFLVLQKKRKTTLEKLSNRKEYLTLEIEGKEIRDYIYFEFLR